MTGTRTAAPAVSQPRLPFGSLTDGIILVVGVLVVPFTIAAVFGVSNTAPDAAAYVRIAFAEVVASTVAIMTVLGLAVHRIVWRRPARSITRLALIAVLVTWWQVGSIVATAATLVERLASLG